LPDGDLSPACKPTRDAQSGDIGARDQQYQCTRSRNQQYGLPGASDHFVNQWSYAGASAAIPIRIPLCQVSRDPVQVLIRLFD
jgi:hypothetical protein